MFNSMDLYVVGFSALLFYVLKTYFQAREVWKQFGLVPFYFSGKIGRIKFCFSSSTIPGRRTLFSEFAPFESFIKATKYIAPGPYRGWVEKHNGIVRHNSVLYLYPI